MLHNPDDDAVLARALTAECEMIISGDEDLLELRQYQEIRILTVHP
jgi:predicted nucleic acid-binding protein